MINFQRILKGTVVAAVLLGTAVSASAANIAIVGGKADDPFFAIVKRGIDDAAKLVQARGGTVNYLALQTYDNIGPDAAQLIRTAVSQGVDGIAAPNWVPDAQDEAYKAAKAAGIPILLYNSGGTDKSKELGSINYIGTEDLVAGQAAGKYLAEHKAKNVLCVNTVPGAANLEARCKGIIDEVTKAGSKATQLPLPATSFGDKTAVSEAIKATLMKDDAIDAVVTMGNQDADSAAIAIQQANAVERVKLGSFNTDKAMLDRIKTGTQMFAVDQQGYLQGYLSVFMLASYVDYAMESPTVPILTGPAIVDSSNVEATLKGVEAGVR
ncbi:substrate-binding domain-containing protein [Rhizobium grahamii]|uniref:Substrate-binding domain-containing protein n=1 Tax=Rhizobium grahamii TaxID=1120045 RepID=A0A5Q0C9C0_9HYPH|nr:MULTISPECIES: substrate-binding domain-containing protein [Rhizobium]QFY60441.1 substrate-binding domain-containing protein [Rhizobium grahamii]QRM50431.1 substrate-binding domain-containing protein [Rhizobium sp. BG6]